jgi:predicted ester cyclase
METLSENKTLTQRFYEDVMNTQNLEKIHSFCAFDFTDHNPPPGHSGRGLDDLAAQLKELFIAMPDFRITPKFMVAEGDKVVVYLNVTGTNSGPFNNLPPSNNKINIYGIDIVRIKDGKAVERWGVFEDLAMLTQMGIIDSEKSANVFQSHREKFNE